MFLATAAVLLLAVPALARPYLSDRDEGRGMSAWTGWGPGMAMFSSSYGDEDPWTMRAPEGRGPPVWRLEDEPAPRSPDSALPKKDSRKKHHSRDHDEEDDDYSGERGGSRANASFNAWFPILLGGYPGSEEASGRGSRQDGQPEREGFAAVANSVNHGRSGVANSHAVVFTGEPMDLVQSNRRRTPTPASYRHR